MYNLTIDVNSGAASGCYNNGDDFWASSQDSPMRRVEVNGNLTFMDFCESPAYASGGFNGDDIFTDGAVTNGSQQQYVTVNSNIDSWSNTVWNQVFCGDSGPRRRASPPTRATAGAELLHHPGQLRAYPARALPLHQLLGRLRGLRALAPDKPGRAELGQREHARDIVAAHRLLRGELLHLGSHDQRRPGRRRRLVVHPGGALVRLDHQCDQGRHQDNRLGFATLIPTAGQTTMSVADVAGSTYRG